MIESLPATASSAEVVDVLNRDGGVIVKSLADHQMCELLEDELAPLLAARKTVNAPYGYQEFLPAKTRRIVGVIAKSRLPHLGHTPYGHGRVRSDAAAEL